MLVRKKTSNDKSVIESFTLFGQSVLRFACAIDNLPLLFYPERCNGVFSIQWIPNYFIERRITQFNPDVIHLHWITNSYISIEAIAKFSKPIVWTLHDMWPFTGGCHYSEGCTRYIDHCGACPILKSKKEYDLSYWVWKRKKKAWANLGLTIVSLNKWMTECAESSSLFNQRRVETIPLGLDLNVFRPLNQLQARKQLNLPENKKLILLGAINITKDERKGFSYLRKIVQNLRKSVLGNIVEIAIFGETGIRDYNDSDFHIRIHHLGYLKNGISLLYAYSAADVMVVPSVQDNFPQTAIEALACGTPVVCFDIAGLKDIVDHQKNGYKAECFNSEDLARGIIWVLQNGVRWQELSRNAREKAVREYALEIQAKRYLDLYKFLLKNKK
jgi:glycosyltransferase involved in cell wall biosynthesis